MPAGSTRSTGSYPDCLSHEGLGDIGFCGNGSAFGAKAEPGFDNRVAFQAAIDAAYESGGGVVFVPRGITSFIPQVPGR